MILLDTDVLIDHLRGRQEAQTYLASLEEGTAISVITVAELYAGLRSGEEKALASLLSLFQVLPVDDEIAKQAGRWVQSYRKSHGLLLPDVLIAATAHRHEATLVTLNTRHFPMFSLQPPYTR